MTCLQPHCLRKNSAGHCYPSSCCQTQFLQLSQFFLHSFALASPPIFLPANMSPFSRFSGLSIRGGGQSQTSKSAKTPVSPRSPKADPIKDQQHKDRVDILLRNPELFAAFKKRVVKTNNFSNASACFVLHDFLEEIDLPSTEAYEVVPSPTTKSGGTGHGYGLGLLTSLRTMAMDPPPTPTTPSSSYTTSPRRHFPCPESPSQNLSPTVTPLTPISATSSAYSVSSTESAAGRTKKRSTLPACLDQPNF